MMIIHPLYRVLFLYVEPLFIATAVYRSYYSSHWLLPSPESTSGSYYDAVAEIGHLHLGLLLCQIVAFTSNIYDMQRAVLGVHLISEAASLCWDAVHGQLLLTADAHIIVMCLIAIRIAFICGVGCKEKKSWLSSFTSFFADRENVSALQGLYDVFAHLFELPAGSGRTRSISSSPVNPRGPSVKITDRATTITARKRQ
eukprot:TRINITY_DN12913_c0_g1_i1.p1 TRINITY_DN12913_c0_g1~~TRINITY_DN12913_c0_g1_i1.p1  ORF type:complete len:199 (+),score=14.67 TRINITY_DN12913_c0_g1_i1:140-736(+)